MLKTKADAGRLGGQTTAKRHGREYFQKIGRLGGRSTHDKYELIPVDQSDFAMVDRKTHELKAYLSGKSTTPWKDGADQ